MISDCLIEYAAERYDFDRDTLRFVTGGRDASRAFYSFDKRGERYIMRVIRAHAGQIGQTCAEIDWVDYLARNGVSLYRRGPRQRV